MFTQGNNALAGIYSNPNTITRTDAQVGIGNPIPIPFGWGNFVTRWEGYLQAPVAGTYTFKVTSNDGIRLWINGALVIDRWASGFQTGTVNITLALGQVCTIRVDYIDTHASGSAALEWKKPGTTTFALVPQSALYSQDNYASSQDNVQTVNGWCTKTDSVNVRGNALTDTFTLVQGRKMLVSAWVKVGGNDCKCSTYVNNKIRISYNNNITVAEFTPAGSIIEGWQRYEGIFDVPLSATQLSVSLMNTANAGGADAWFDDLRIHPFNANMKSFVYHPQNLRLMGELDENNYASFYEYDDDGTLSRVKKETINGVKTITETRSHLQKVIQ